MTDTRMRTSETELSSRPSTDGHSGGASAAPEAQQQVHTWQEELAATSDDLVARVRELVEEVNVRRLIITHEGRARLEIPLTLGVVGALLASQVAARGALAALLTRCTLAMEREAPVLPAPSDAVRTAPPAETEPPTFG
jgi:hypothetical protein